MGIPVPSLVKLPFHGTPFFVVFNQHTETGSKYLVRMKLYDKKPQLKRYELVGTKGKA